MKFSVLIPTRNRLELLKYAVETVRRQNYDNWEIIISDNFSEQNIESFVRNLEDPRVKYFRTERFVPVTENWNNAMSKTSGDYIVTLGDDDCLMQGYFKTINQMIETHIQPDFVYTNSFLYAYPGVIPEFPNGFIQLYNYGEFFRQSIHEPFWLRKKVALKLVHHSMKFNMLYTFNMQHSVISREFIDKLKSKGPFFQSPYPDFYATNVLMLRAERILICPYPIVTIGISPKSFGYYYFNDREDEGIEFLRNYPDKEIIFRLGHVILPGLRDRTSWLIAMETIKKNYGSETKLQPNYLRYRFLQILYVYCRHYFFSRHLLDSKIKIAELKESMRWWEKILYSFPFWAFVHLTAILPVNLQRFSVNKLISILNARTPQLGIKKKQCGPVNILEVFEKIDPLQEFKGFQ